VTRQIYGGAGRVVQRRNPIVVKGKFDYHLSQRAEFIQRVFNWPWCPSYNEVTFSRYNSYNNLLETSQLQAKKLPPFL